MRKLFFTLSALLLLQVTAFSQTNEVIITEIMYNIPGNTEDVEFIELYNPSSVNTVTLNDFTFTQGVTFTFPSAAAGAITIAPNSYFVIAADSADFNSTFGMNPNATWFNGGLSNSGEDITILNANGVMVDSVDYDDGAPWPTAADGQGRSLQLCDLLTDNNVGSNWGTTNTPAGTNTTGDSIYATPGMMNSCVTVVPPPPVSYPLYTIDMINNLDANGVADSVSVTCELRAIAYCIDSRGGSGLDFPFAQSDNSAGIRIFTFLDVDNYVHTAGDSLHIWGEVLQFNGLLQFRPDSILVISQGNTIPNPMIVTQLSEMTENKYVQLNGVSLVDTAEWTGTGGGFNVRVTTGSTDTLSLRIDNDVDLYSQPAPMGTFSIAGWGGQFDASSPFSEGYQLVTCGSVNFVNTTSIEAPLAVRVYPNPASRFLTVEAGVVLETVIVYNALGQVVLSVNNLNTTNTQINTNELANGIYTISIVSGERVSSQLFQVAK
ncbi:MAG: lamin tail domain-containing protein [Aureispira sp.]